MFQFPNPSETTSFVINGKEWRWVGSYWELVKTAVSGGGISFYQQDDAPIEAKLGDRWLNTQNLTEYIYVQMSANPDVFQWMDLTGDYPGDTFVGD